MSPTDGRGVAVAGIIGAAVVAALLLVPGLRLGAIQPWLGAVVMLIPTAVLLAATGSRHYGVARGVAVGLVVAVLAGGVSWLVAVFTLVKALSGVGVGLAWAILLFLTPAVSVLALGARCARHPAAVVSGRCDEVPHGKTFDAIGSRLARPR